MGMKCGDEVANPHGSPSEVAGAGPKARPLPSPACKAGKRARHLSFGLKNGCPERANGPSRHAGNQPAGRLADVTKRAVGPSDRELKN